MNEAEVRDVFVRHGAILSGHFKLSSGRHSDTYLQCAKVLEHPRVAFSLGEALSSRLCAERGDFDVVASPALGGVLIGYAVAHAAGARFVFAERVDGAFAVRRGQTAERGERAIVVEDVVTTGGSAGEVVELLRTMGLSVGGVGAVVDRSAGALPFPLSALLRVPAESWEAAACPLCARAVPLDAPGSRHLTGGVSGTGQPR